MYDDKPITIKMADKPNLRALRFHNPKKFKEVLSACIALAEEAAYVGEDRKIPWYDLPSKFSPDLDFENTLKAVSAAVFEAQAINPDSFSILEEDVHALAVFKSQSDRTGTYPDWRRHFDFPDGYDPAGPKEVTAILRKLLYYARFIDMDKYSKAVLSNHLSVHQALPELNAEKLPFVPALRYQQDQFGDLKVGKFWDDIGAFYGGEMPAGTSATECPACKAGAIHLKQAGQYLVCECCNIGIKIK